MWRKKNSAAGKKPRAVNRILRPLVRRSARLKRTKATKKSKSGYLNLSLQNEKGGVSRMPGDTSFFVLFFSVPGNCSTDKLHEEFCKGKSLAVAIARFSALRGMRGLSFHQFEILFFKFLSVQDNGNLMKPGVKYPCRHQTKRMFPGNGRYGISCIFFFAYFMHFHL